MNTTKVMTRINADRAAGKSVGTRIGSRNETKRIELKHLCAQQLVQNGIVSIQKVGTLDNLAGIFTKYIGADTQGTLLQSRTSRKSGWTDADELSTGRVPEGAVTRASNMEGLRTTGWLSMVQISTDRAYTRWTTMIIAGWLEKTKSWIVQIALSPAEHGHGRWRNTSSQSATCWPTSLKLEGIWWTTFPGWICPLRLQERMLHASADIQATTGTSVASEQRR